jgi:hypothetical protein
MENRPNKTRLFSVELKSKAHIKNIIMTSGSPESVMIEGVLGELVKAFFAEGIILEIVGTNGVLRVDLGHNEITKPELKDKEEAK